MKPLRSVLIISSAFTPLVQRLHLANAIESTGECVVVPDLGQLIGAANALELDEHGWAEIPYGDWPHSGADGRRLANSAALPTRIVQRFTRAHAEKMVGDFKSVWGRIKRAITGLPVFKGHPDAPRYANLFPDKTPRGVIADMEAGELGLRVKPVLTAEGAGDVEAGFKFFSPYWESVHAANASDGAAIYEPARLFSLGLVQRGNIPTLALTNAAEESAPSTTTETPAQESTTMPKWLIDLLIAAGLLKAESATEEAARPALEKLISEATTMKTKNEELATANSALTVELATSKEVSAELTKFNQNITGEKAALANSLELERTALKAERKARALLLVNAAIVEGRVPAAERDGKVAALANAADFTAEATALAALPKQLKTASTLGELSKQGREMQTRQEQTLALVNAAMDTPEIKALPEASRYDAAFLKVSTDPKNQPLFTAMRRPA